MSNKIYPQGTAFADAAASDKIAVFSMDECKIYTRADGATSALSWALLKELAPETEYLSSALSAAKEVKIEAGASEVFYAIGTAPVITERRAKRGQGTPGALDATGALTAALMGGGIVTSAAAAVTATVPTGTVMDAAVEMEIDESFDWSVIKTGANAFTVTAATGHTLVGSGVVAATSSATFRTRKTAANTFITYRLA
jgi:hypothetical protein